MFHPIGIVGLGTVGNAIYDSLNDKGCILFSYDKYKNIGSINDLLHCKIVFLALPTNFDNDTKEYDKSAIDEVCDFFNNNSYYGGIILKSTVEPTYCEELSEKYGLLNIIFNPEFLTARTAKEDYNNQSHIVLGQTRECDNDIFNTVVSFYETYFPNSEISICLSEEAETMKIVANTFYSVKIQFFNEIYSLCSKLDIDYDIVVNLILKNGWITKDHTQVPGPDGQLSYGGACFPKDSNALLNFMKRNNSYHAIIDASIKEKNEMRQN